MENFEDRCPNFNISEIKDILELPKEVIINNEICVIEPYNKVLRHYIPIKEINIGELTCKKISILKYFFNLEAIYEDAEHPIFLINGIRSSFALLIILSILFVVYVVFFNKSKKSTFLNNLKKKNFLKGKRFKK